MSKALLIGLVLLIAFAGVTLPVLAAGTPVYGDAGQGAGSDGFHLTPLHINHQLPHLGDTQPVFTGNPSVPYD